MTVHEEFNGRVTLGELVVELGVRSTVHLRDNEIDSLVTHTRCEARPFALHSLAVAAPRRLRRISHYGARGKETVSERIMK